jgi:hypothetical protein
VRRLNAGLVALRATGTVALVLLIWNPLASRAMPPDAQSIVLLDASLSMAGVGGAWRAALDSARADHAALIWRFGARVTAFDTTAPADGASRLAPALEAAAARGGAVTLVTDGSVDDLAAIPPDLLRRPRIVVLGRPPFRDAFIAGVEGDRHVTAADTIRLRVSYGTAGKRETGNDKRNVALTVSLAGRRLASRGVALPDSGTISTELTFPVSRFPSGWSVLDVRLEGVGDAEPRDDGRRFVIEVSPQPAAVVFASPPDWETRFLARTLAEVARVPVKTFVETEPGRWRDAATLAPVATTELARAGRGARLQVLGGDPERSRPFAGPGARLVWSTARGQSGDWYVEHPPASPLTGGGGAALAGVQWDSLPPAASVGETPRDSGSVTALTARLARRGGPRPIVVLEERGGVRQVTVSASGLWRWAFRGGASEQAYRSLVAGVADWLLGGTRGAAAERAVPVTLETPNGLPLTWRWIGAGEPRPLAIALESDRGPRADTLRFDAAGHAELRLAPGVYRYAMPGGPERGVVAVEEYSAEWRPAAPALAAQAGRAEGRFVQIGLRDRWWLFVIAIAAFAAEWALRRRQGLP